MWRLIAAIFASTFLSCSALAQVKHGEIFGYQVGEMLEAYERNQVKAELFGAPWVDRPIRNSAEEFDRLEVVVTPMSGTILGIRAIAEFEDVKSADNFANDMKTALRLRFGPNQFKHVWYSSLSQCREADSTKVCTVTPPENARFATRVSRYRLELYRYAGSANTGSSVHLEFGFDEDGPENQRYKLLLEQEEKEYREWLDVESVRGKKENLLTGID